MSSTMYPCACKTPDDLDGCMEMVDTPDTLCEFCEDCRQPEDDPESGPSATDASSSPPSGNDDAIGAQR